MVTPRPTGLSLYHGVAIRLCKERLTLLLYIVGTIGAVFVLAGLVDSIRHLKDGETSPFYALIGAIGIALITGAITLLLS